MSYQTANPRSSMEDLLSKLSRYEALFELTGAINAAEYTESVSEALARRLKYIADVYSWRYICIDGDLENPDRQDPMTIVVDGYRGRTDVMRTIPSSLSNFEMELWRDRKTHILYGDQMKDALAQLPSHFQKDNLEQISANALVQNGKTQALFLFCKQRRPFTDLDVKFLSMVCIFFHRKMYLLWEQQKLRDLERAYLQQEVMLRQSEKLATLGRLSAGMAHELNNPASAAKRGSEQLLTVIARLERAQFDIGKAGLSNEQNNLIAKFQEQVEERAKKPTSLGPIARSDRQEEIEHWLDQNGVNDPWQLAPTLVAMGLCAAELEVLTKNLDGAVTPIVVDYFASKFTAYTLIEEVSHGTGRITEIVKALKGYSYMDQAPVQLVDVREGLKDTLVMVSSKLREGIKVDLDFAENLPRIEGYGRELNQVWTNLLDNAISALSSKGTIELKAYEAENWVVVEVADNGPGIPVEAQGKIFDPFYTTKAPGEGTGLGLNISHNIVVEKHGGQISVNSKPGATRFTVKLPITCQSSGLNKESESLRKPP